MIGDSSHIAIPLVLMAQAQAAAHELGWLVPIAQGSLSLGIIIWFAWQHGLDRKERQKQHEDNLAAQREVRDALRSYFELNIIGMRAMKGLDASWVDLMEQFKTQQNKTHGT